MNALILIEQLAGIWKRLVSLRLLYFVRSARCGRSLNRHINRIVTSLDGKSQLIGGARHGLGCLPWRQNVQSPESPIAAKPIQVSGSIERKLGIFYIISQLVYTYVNYSEINQIHAASTPHDESVTSFGINDIGPKIGLRRTK